MTNYRLCEVPVDVPHVIFNGAAATVTAGDTQKLGPTAI